MGQFYYAAKAFDALEKLDPGSNYWEGKRGACVGVFQLILANKESRYVSFVSMYLSAIPASGSVAQSCHHILKIQKLLYFEYFFMRLCFVGNCSRTWFPSCRTRETLRSNTSFESWESGQKTTESFYRDSRGLLLSVTRKTLFCHLQRSFHLDVFSVFMNVIWNYFLLLFLLCSRVLYCNKLFLFVVFKCVTQKPKKYFLWKNNGE